VSIDAVARVCRDEHGEVAALWVQILHELGDARAVAAGGDRETVAAAKREVLGAGDLYSFVSYLQRRVVKYCGLRRGQGQ
jgi:hypothetical protein